MSTHTTKTVYFLIESLKTYRGYKAINIFKIENNIPEFIGQTKYQPATTPGVQSEAWKWLKQNNKVKVTTDQAQQTYFDTVRGSVDFDIMSNDYYLELK